MKKHFYYFMRSLMMMAIVVATSVLMAQSAKIQIADELGGFYTGKMSTNGRFLTCGSGASDLESTAAVWDRQTNKVTIISDIASGKPATAQDVSNDGVVVGRFVDPAVVFQGSPVFSGGWWKDGVWHSLGVHPDFPISGLSAGSGSQAAAITADGQYIGGYVFISKTKLVPCTWKRNENGEYVFHTAYAVGADSYQGGRVWDMSDDGQVVVGWESMSSGGSAWAPTMWTAPDVALRPTVTTAGLGMFNGVNPEGTIAVGSPGVIFNVDGTTTMLPISLTSIASNGMVTTSKGVWTDKIGVWELLPYLKKFWNIQIDESRYSADVVYTISGDGKYIGGCLFDMNIKGRVPFVVSLEGLPVAIAPDVVNTVLKQVAGEVDVTWEKPVFNGYEPIGYNVYRDNQKINSELLTVFEFTDVNPVVGANCYSVTAVYQYDTATESAKSVASCIEVIAEDGCFSPKHLAAEIIYNKRINLSWGMPLPNYGTVQPEKSKSSEPVKIKPTYLKKYQLGPKNNYEVHPASDGNYIYLLNYNDNFFRYTMDGDFEQRFKLGSMFLANYFAGLTYVDGYYYTTSNLFINGVSTKLDLDNKAIVTGFNSETKREKHRISYIPTLDDGNGGFELGTDTSSYFYKKDLVTEMGVGLKNISGVCGTTYHDGKIYATIQKEGELIIKLYDAETGEYANEYIDLKDYTNLTFTETAKLGGISTFKSTENILCLAVVVMDSPNNSLIFLQLEQMEGLLGYNVFRNGVKINSEMITETIFSEDITVPGDYTYNVTSLFEGGCESAHSFPVSVTINPLGTCNTPKNMKVELIRNNAQLTWTAPQAVEPHALVGYNVYRNDVKLNSELIKNTFYTDLDLEFGDYSYQVEAFYDNSCVSDKSEPITVSVKGYNVVRAPKNLSIDVKNDSEAVLNWDVPAIGDYAALKWYNGGVEWTVGEEGGGTVYVGTKWDANDLRTYFDYTLTDVEFYAAENVPHTFYVYVDGVVVSEQHLATVTAGAFNLLKLDRPVLIEKGKELMVAYKVTNVNEKYVIGADNQPSTNNKGDLLSYDGVTWTNAYKNYGVRANWAITIRLMPYSLSNAESKGGEQRIELEAYNEGKLVDRAMDSKVESMFVNSEVVGYNVYKGDNKIGNVGVNQYPVSIDGENDCYAVEAVYTANRVSAKTGEVCIYGNCVSATALKDKNITAANVEMSWTAPKSENKETVELNYNNGNFGDAIAFGQNLTFYAFLQSTVMDMSRYDNLKLKSIKAFILQDCKVSLVVVQDGKIVMEEATRVNKVGDYNVFEIENGGFDIDVKKNLLVGLKVTVNAQVFSLGIDAGPAVGYRGDVISMDAKELTTLSAMSNGQLNRNWSMSANFEQTMKNSEVVLGYNIYRDGVQINNSLVENNSYNDQSVSPKTKYEYHVTTVWNTGCESEASNSISVTTEPSGVNDMNEQPISIFPNPAKGKINIDGDYSSLRIYNNSGMLVCKYDEKMSQIDVSSMAAGVYVIEIAGENNDIIQRTKLVVTK